LGTPQVSDIVPLATLTALEYLELDETQVNDVAPLAALTRMRYLNVRGTQVTDLSPLQNIEDINIDQ
jgi:Leucine-rich repeat (LRR) protein